MSVVRHCFSNRRRVRVLAALALLPMFVIGCTTASLEQTAPTQLAATGKVDKTITGARKIVGLGVPEASGSSAKSKLAKSNAAISEKRISALKTAGVNDGEFNRHKPWNSRGSSLSAARLEKQRGTAWCRYLTAEANAERTILHSPTVKGDFDQDGKASVGVAYDLVDVARADLKKTAAEARCRRYHALGQISRAVYVTPQSLTYNGNLSKAKYLRSNLGRIAAIRRKLNAHVARGEMTSQTRTVLSQYGASIASREGQARSEAKRRETAGVLDPKALRGLDRELTEVERQIQEIERRNRTLDAVSVQASAGIGYEDDNGFRSDDAYARVKVSYRIGAGLTRRHEYEDEAVRARIEALYEETHGVLRRPHDMAEAIDRAKGGIRDQRRKIAIALGEAKRNAKAFATGYEEEMLASRYRAQIDIVALNAELHGLDATLKDMARIQRDLNFE